MRKGNRFEKGSNNEIIAGRLINGFDYQRQAWVVNGIYVRCGHPDALACGCYGRDHAGESTEAVTNA